MIEFMDYGHWSRSERAKQHLLVLYHAVIQWIKVRLVTKKAIMIDLGYRQPWQQKALKEQIVSQKHYDSKRLLQKRNQGWGYGCISEPTGKQPLDESRVGTQHWAHIGALWPG